MREKMRDPLNYDTLVIKLSCNFNVSGRLLFNVKCELGEKFRKRVTGILDGMWLEVKGLARAEQEMEENSEEDSVYDFLETY